MLIVNGDDVGVSHAANQATIASLERGLMTSATIMVPAPWFPEIARYAREHPGSDFGLHLVHTSEWTGIKWGPVAGRTVVPGLVDPQGYLWPDIERVYKNATPEQAAVEARAQIRKALDAGIDVTHLDSHMGALQFADPYFQVYRGLAVEFNVPIRMGSQETLAAFGGGHQRGQLDADGVVYPDYLIHGGRLKDEAGGRPTGAGCSRGCARASPSSTSTRRFPARRCRRSPTPGRTALPSSSLFTQRRVDSRAARAEEGPAHRVSGAARSAEGPRAVTASVAGNRRRWSRRVPVLVAGGSLLALLALAPLVFQADSFTSIDTAIKLIQATELTRSGFQSMALSYPARDLDPTEQFLPFEDPFVFLSAGKWQSIFSSFYALLAAPVVPHGVEWLVAWQYGPVELHRRGSRRMDRARHRHRRHDPGNRLARDGDGCGCRGRAARARDPGSGHRPGRDVRDRDRRRALLRAQAAAGPAGQWSDLSRTLARHGVHRFTHLARDPTTTPHFPEYRRAEVWGSGRFILSRWVLETSASP